MGLVTGPHTQAPRTLSQWVAGPSRTPQGWVIARGRAPNPGRPTRRQEAPPRRAPSCPLHSAQSQPGGARAEGSVMAPHAHNPRSHSQRVAGTGCTPQGQAVGCGRGPNPRRPTRRQEAPPRRPRVAPTVRKASSHPLHPQPVGSGPWPHAPRTGGWARESAQLRKPYTQARDAPLPGGPRAAPQRAKGATKSARCGIGCRSPHQLPPEPQPVGSGPQPHAPRTDGRARESAQPRTPHTQARDAFPRRPHAAPRARKGSSQERALEGW